MSNLQRFKTDELKDIATKLKIDVGCTPTRKNYITSIRKSQDKKKRTILRISHPTKVQILKVPNNGCVRSIKGEREYMEDTYVIAHKPGIKLYGVFDGHSGKSVSNFLKQHLAKRVISGVIKTDLTPINVIKVIRNVYNELDTVIMNKHYKGDPGSTAIVAMLVGDILYFINVGDSRGLLIRDGRVIYRTIDHKPNNKKEKDRVVKAGGKVTIIPGDVYRVEMKHIKDKQIAMSRCFGDFDFKTDVKGRFLGESAPLIVTPSIKYIRLVAGVKYTILLGSDGVWDVMSNTVVSNAIKQMRVSNACDHIMQESLKSGDNITVLLANIKISKKLT